MLRTLVPYLAYAYLTFVGLTTRLRRRGQERRDSLRRSNQRFIYAFWHQRQAFFTWTHRGENVAVLVSRSGDGELIARTLALAGTEAIRGSSSRGAAAATLELLEAAKAGRDCGITPDGPRGPARQVKPGVLFLARELGIPILPMTNALSRKITLKRSWDQFQVPLPFGRAVLSYGTPIEVKPGDDLAAKARELKAELDRITLEADREAGA